MFLKNSYSYTILQESKGQSKYINILNQNSKVRGEQEAKFTKLKQYQKNV